MKWIVLLLMLCFALHSQAQEAHLSLMTPDSGSIEVNWEHRFYWNKEDELYLIIKVPSNIELVGLAPKTLRDGIEYELPVRDLFIKVKAIMHGTNHRILSSQGLTIQINDQKRGIVKRDPACPKDLNSPLFNRTIISQRCQSVGDQMLITERGFVNGTKYEHNYQQTTRKRHPAKRVQMARNFSLGLGLGLLDQKRASAGDGLYLQALAASEINHRNFTFTPSLALGLIGLMSNTHQSPFKTRRDELKLTAHYNLKGPTPELHLKTFGRSESDHYFMGVAVGAGLHYQLKQTLPLRVFGAIYPQLSTREYQNYLIGVSYSHQQTQYIFQIDHESYSVRHGVKTQLYGASLNVSQRF